MKMICMPERIHTWKTIARIRAAQVFRVLREYYPGVGLTLAACLALAKRRGKDASSISVPPRRILVIRLDAMGDLVMATPIFRQLKQAYPNASITALVPMGNLDLLQANPFVDRIITLLPIRRSLLPQRVRRDISIVRMYWKFLRGEHFDIALQPRLGPDYFGANLLLALVSASCRIKYEDDLKRGPSKYLDVVAYRSITKVPRPTPQHEVLSNSDFIRSLTGRAFSSPPEIFVSQEDRSYAEHLFEGTDSVSTILCVAFGAQAKRRQWPLEHWAETLYLLAQDRNMAVVIVCSRTETWEGERLRLLLDSTPGINSRIVSGASLRQVAACIEACDLLLGTDSGLAHLAAAVGCATLVVSPHPVHGDPYHENSPLRFKPYSDSARVLQPETSRSPCGSGCDAVEPHCILNVTPRQVAGVAREMLLSSRSSVGKALQGPVAYPKESRSTNETTNAAMLDVLRQNEISGPFATGFEHGASE